MLNISVINSIWDLEVIIIRIQAFFMMHIPTEYSFFGYYIIEYFQCLTIWNFCLLDECKG